MPKTMFESTPSQTATWLAALFSTIDDKNTSLFGEFLTDTVEFRFANNPTVKGKAAVIDYIQGFFASIDSLSHAIEQFVSSEETVVCQGHVTYIRHDGSSLCVPFSNWFTCQDHQISHYQIFVDTSLLYA